jgi:ribosome biogenesis SPOUT family RNA methylase Rps3
MKTSDASEKIYELVGGLFGHARPKHITNNFGSHKWTPVHPGELKSNQSVFI